jgi:hypothetical protein
MKNLLLVGLLASSTAQAQVAECPKFYPWQDTVLAEVPYQHKGKGVVAKQRLAGAGAFWGDFNDTAEIHGGPEKRVKGGTDTEMPANTRWLVCWYGPGRSISWWEELKADGKASRCTLQVRDGGRDPMDIKMVCK